MSSDKPMPVPTNLPAPKPRAALITGAAVAPVVPRTIEEVARVAEAVIVAGLAPDSYKGNDIKQTAAKVMIGIMKGAEVGFPPLTALATIAIIRGRPCLWGDGAVGLVQASGKVDSWEENYEGKENTDKWKCIVKITRKGQPNPYVGEYSYGDARRAKLLTKENWITGPRGMLGWRARTKAMRLGFADCLCGLSILEEVRDLPPEPPKLADTSVLDDDEPLQIIENKQDPERA